MTMRIFVTILVLAVIFCDCKKGDNSLQHGITYHRSANSGGSIRVFGSSGEIIDATIVNRFTQLDDANMTTMGTHLGTLDTIQIVDGNNARLFENGRYSDFAYASISRDFNFYNSDTISGYTYGEVYTRTVNYYLCLYKPIVYVETIASSTAGTYQFLYKGRKEYFIEEKNNQLVAPWIVFYYHFPSGSSAFSIQNRLDKNFYKSLQPRDTVVLREHSLSYE